MNRTISNRYAYAVILFFIIIFVIVILFQRPPSDAHILENSSLTSLVSTVAPLNVNEALVTNVLDGDTIEINGNTKVRYIGIDTPEMSDSNCHAAAAKARNVALVLDRNVILEKDVSDRDRYNRLLRYVYLTDGTFVNKLLVSEGLARTLYIKPDIAQYEVFRSLEHTAKAEKKGLWGDCPTIF